GAARLRDTGARARAAIPDPHACAALAARAAQTRPMDDAPAAGAGVSALRVGGVAGVGREPAGWALGRGGARCRASGSPRPGRGALVLIACAAWVPRASRGARTWGRRAAALPAAALALVAVAIGVLGGVSSPRGATAADAGWELFTPARLVELRGAGKPVFV